MREWREGLIEKDVRRKSIKSERISLKREIKVKWGGRSETVKSRNNHTKAI